MIESTISVLFEKVLQLHHLFFLLSQLLDDFVLLLLLICSQAILLVVISFTIDDITGAETEIVAAHMHRLYMV